ncbi:MAG TPA: TauD/TfdA family dioxygenase [Burkholderiales bacterium]|nr:TauD/TfdA family dioxygenase [Burkholderiales bacterium]
MSLRLQPLHPLFAAEAGGVDLREPPDAKTAGEIVAAMDRYAVLVFRGPVVSEEAQLAFGRAFGPLDLGLGKVLKRPNRLRHDESIDISNVDGTGGIASLASKKMYSQLANQLWHSDSSFQKPPARYSMLHSIVNPARGGETEFADLRAAYDALPADLKREVEGLRAQHYALHSRIALGDTDWTEEQRNTLPPVEWPLVRVHPGSKRKLLFVGVHATHIVGMHVGQGRLLLAELLEHATQPRFVYRHEWRAGDLVMWDNRSVVHRGRRYDYSQRRELRRVSTEDVPAAAEQAA